MLCHLFVDDTLPLPKRGGWEWTDAQPSEKLTVSYHILQLFCMR